MLSLTAYIMLAWQLSFPLFAWRPRRAVLIGGMALGWIGLAVIYRLPLLGPALFVGCLGFVTADEWYRVITWLSALPGLHWLDAWLPAVPVEPVDKKPDVASEEPASTLITVGHR